VLACVSKTTGDILKTYRAYLKHYPKWKYYELSLKKQRQLIIQNGIELPESEIDEKITHELPKPKTEELQTSGVYDLLEGKRGTTTLRNDNNTKKVICCWYIDLYDRQNINLLYEEYETSDLIITSDFVTDFSKYDCQPDYVVTENTKESLFYEKLFRLIRGGEYSYREISDLICTKELNISHTQIGEMKKIVEL
jgi:hypothetical protein